MHKSFFRDFTRNLTYKGGLGVGVKDKAMQANQNPQNRQERT